MMNLVKLRDLFFNKLFDSHSFFELIRMTPIQRRQALATLIVSLLFTIPSSAQCTVSGSGTINFGSITCIETGNPLQAGDDLIIPSGVTVRTTSNNQNLGTRNIIIESGGTLHIRNNNITLDGNIIVEGTFQIDDKIYLACGSALSVSSGGLVVTGSSSGASDRLSICGEPIIQGGGGCNTADGNPDTDPPYCAGGAGISGPTGFDESGEVPGVLPIKLLSFKATDQARGVQLDWTTAIEERNAYFDLENSRDGQSYNFVGRIEGAGNSSSMKNYSYLHEDPYSGVSYYRLVQVDTDETWTIYGPVRVDRTIVGEMAVFPNPLVAGQKLNIRRSNKDQGEIQISLMDLQGRVIKGWKMGEELDFQLDIPGEINKGIYLLEISGGGKKKLHRLVLQ